MSERIIGGKYRLDREIARGGMGAIWVAFDPSLKRRVALKLMSPEHVTSPASRARFEVEAMSIAQLQNAHVIQVYDYGIDDDSPYIVMELLEGEDLETRLRSRQRLPLSAVIPIVVQAAKALRAAHHLGIVHRDLKPANIFLARSATEELVKILDFGIASLLSSGPEDDTDTSLQSSYLLGTPAYMSPEQAKGSKLIDPRSDLWSLGVAVYRALTGQLPFVAQGLSELLVRICTEAPVPPSSIAPELGPDVDRFFERALAKDPARRFQSAREMAGAFAALADLSQVVKTAKILVIDDEPDMASLIKQRFRQQIRKSVYEFLFAADGVSALEVLRRHPDIDVALSDINMPKMDGLTFLDHVGEIAPMLKVIMVSAYSDMANIRKAMSRGAFDFLVKPIDLADLEASLDKAVKRAEEVRKTVQSAEENNILRMFVSGGMVDKLLPLLRGVDVTVGETVNATVAFIDLCGTSAVIKSMGPDEVVGRLNASFEVIVPEISIRHGVVDKFVGDAAMAVFRGKDHAVRALEACVAIRTELARLAGIAGPSSPYAQGVAIGVATGDMVSGSVGSKTQGRMDYTVLGEPVNRAAHLASLADRDQILMDAELHAAVRHLFVCTPQKSPSKAGPAEGLPAYSVLGSTTDRAELTSMPTIASDEEQAAEGSQAAS